TFGPATLYGVGDHPSSSFAADLNADGQLDLAVTNYGSTFVSVLPHDGPSLFLPAVNYDTRLNSSGIQAADFDGDGRMDLAMVCYQDSTVSVLKNITTCCDGFTGNVDCDPNQGVDISDLSALIDNLFISFSPLCCTYEANVDGEQGIDISDLSALIDYLFINFTPTAVCQ
ncbi:MAG: VCBS repeat-containing protein, partial [candidate division Zixibacteria bacterium]|nr:VCBS repeat-containing protein [candidate division Zixibacteria bacterium]